MFIAQGLDLIDGSICKIADYVVTQKLMTCLCSIDCQNDLSSSITKVNKQSKLFVIREAPQTVLVKMFKAWRITHLVFEKDTDAYARERDEDVIKQANAAGVEVVVKTGRTLYDPDELVKANGGKPTMSITQVEHVCFYGSI